MLHKDSMVKVLVNPNRKTRLKPRYPATDPMLEKVLDAIYESGLTLTQISVKSGVHIQTLHRWTNHKVNKPHRLTMEFVLNVCGKTMQIIDFNDVDKSGKIVDLEKIRQRSLKK